MFYNIMYKSKKLFYKKRKRKSKKTAKFRLYKNKFIRYIFKK